MAKDRKKLQHIHSSVPDKKPTPASLKIGELAVNNAANQEFISTKNSNDKVVRFSSDEQIITWTEKKEVIPYSGTVENIHLDTNRSNIEIKLNQVVAHNTVKNDVVNGAKDIDGNLVNPSSDGGLTNGAGFAIDTSAFALQGGNPSFSSVTTTCNATLNGTTEIKGKSDECGSKFTVDVQNVCIDASNKLNEAGIEESNFGVSCDGTKVSNKTILKGKNILIDSPEGDKKVDIKACEGIKLTSKNISLENGDCGDGQMTIEVADLCLVGEDKANVYGEKTNIGLDCDDSKIATDTRVFGNGTLITTKLTPTQYAIQNNIQIEAAQDIKENADRDIVETAGSNITETAAGNITENTTNGSIYENAKNIYNTATNNICDQALNEAMFYGASGTNVGVNCDNTATAATTTVKGGKVIVDASTTNLELAAKEGIIESAEKDIIITANNDICETASSKASFYGAEVTRVGATCDGSTKTQQLEIGGEDVCVDASDRVSVYGVNKSDLGINCTENGRSTLTRVSGDTVSVGGNIVNTSSNTNINETAQVINNTASSTANYKSPIINVSANTAVNITANGAEGDVTIHANDTLCESAKTVSIFASDGGKLTIGGNSCAGNSDGTYPITYVRRPKAGTCEIHSTTIDDALDEVYDRSRISLTSTVHTTADRTYTAYTIHQDSGACDASVNFTVNGTLVSMSAETYPASSEMLKKYTFWQYLGTERKEIGVIDIPKDHILKDVSIVNGKLNGSSFTPCPTGDNTCSWFIKLVWNVFDPSTGHADDKVVYLPADDLVKDIDENNTNTGRGVNVDVWYDGKKNQVSATTKVTIKNANGTGTKEFSRANGFHTLNSYTLKSVSGDVKTNNAATNWTYDPFDKQLTITAATDASHINRKTLSWRYGDVKSAIGGTYDPGDGTVNTMGSSRTMEFVIPTSVGDLSAGSLSVTHNGFNETFDVKNSQNWTLPHSALTATYEATSGKSGTVTYNTSAASSISIPTCVNHLNRHKITFSKGSVSAFTSQTYDPGKDCANTAETINIPTSIDELSNWNGTCINLPHNVCVDGTVTASGAIYSSDRRLKENIRELTDHDLDTVERIKLKKFNFISDKSKTTTYGVIAQELRNIGMANIVHTNDEGYYGVDYTSLFILEIASLKREIQRLKNRVSELEKDKNQ